MNFFSIISLGLVFASAAFACWFLTRFTIKKRTVKRRIIDVIARVLAGLSALSIFITLVIFVVSLFLVLPLINSEPIQTPLMKMRGHDHARTQDLVPFAQIPPRLIAILLIAEDPRFFLHKGFDLRNTLFALRLNLQRGFGSYGGSTITQQLARTLFLLPEKTLTRKFIELCISLEMEWFLSKNRIMELYINFAEMGPNIWGIPHAAKVYYDVDPNNLSLLSDYQIAVLLSILPSPLRLNPENYQLDPSILRRFDRIQGWQEKYAHKKISDR